jgi:hypothetical protein
MNLVRRFLKNKELRLAGIFLVLVEKTNVNRDFERKIRGMFGDLVLEATIPRSIKFEETNARQLPLFDHAPKSAGARAYEALALEAMSRGNGHQEERLDPACGGSSRARRRLRSWRGGRGRRTGRGRSFRSTVTLVLGPVHRPSGRAPL